MAAIPRRTLQSDRKWRCGSRRRVCCGIGDDLCTGSSQGRFRRECCTCTRVYDHTKVVSRSCSPVSAWRSGLDWY
ncbi:unnamed protein product [Amoebophrya sp. A25]|nr:unnamed protein product [Amoebophrya sp. A25]|eukprot:GSA25T00004190001.1